jgi:hypothetical protein
MLSIWELKFYEKFKVRKEIIFIIIKEHRVPGTVSTSLQSKRNYLCPKEHMPVIYNPNEIVEANLFRIWAHNTAESLARLPHGLPVCVEVPSANKIF